MGIGSWLGPLSLARLIGLGLSSCVFGSARQDPALWLCDK